MSLTGFALDETPKTVDAAISSIDGNICRCTGYKSIERAAETLTNILNEKNGQTRIDFAIEKGIVPDSFANIKNRLEDLQNNRVEKAAETENRLQENAGKFGVEDESDAGYPKTIIKTAKPFVGGGTDLYVQNPEEMVYAAAENLFDDLHLRSIEESGEFIEIGASVVVTDLLASPVFQTIFPNLYKHLKLVSSTPIRNMATIAGNFINASPIGDMTAWFLALDATIVFNSDREIPLRELYLGYKTLAKTDDEYITKTRFRKNFSHFNFEKVSKRTYLDISTVNTAISLKVKNDFVIEAHVSAGGVAPIPLYLRATSEVLRGKQINEETIAEAVEILQTEISPISDVRGTAEYKRLLARQLFTAHFVELFKIF
jgi:xanthine dehydrogenase small subunit